MSNFQESDFQTTQKVKVEYQLANPLHRMVAFAIDTLIKGVIGIILFIIFMFIFIPASVSANIFDEDNPMSFIITFYIIIGIVLFLAFTAYNLIFELLWRGQTPGKKIVNIRVVNDDGSFASVSAIIIRNIFRIVDFLPLYYAAGIITMFISKKNKRVGDIVASTIVILEEKIGAPTVPEKITLPCYENLSNIKEKVSPGLKKIIQRYIETRGSMMPSLLYNVEEEIIGLISKNLETRRPDMVSRAQYIEALYYKIKD